MGLLAGADLEAALIWPEFKDFSIQSHTPNDHLSTDDDMLDMWVHQMGQMLSQSVVNKTNVVKVARQRRSEVRRLMTDAERRPYQK